MKRLTILYNGREIFDDDVAEFSWQESEGDISVRGRAEAKPKVDFGEMLSSALRKRNEQSVVQEPEPAPEPPPQVFLADGNPAQ